MDDDLHKVDVARHGYRSHLAICIHKNVFDETLFSVLNNLWALHRIHEQSIRETRLDAHVFSIDGHWRRRPVPTSVNFDCSGFGFMVFNKI